MRPTLSSWSWDSFKRPSLFDPMTGDPAEVARCDDDQGNGDNETGDPPDEAPPRLDAIRPCMGNHAHLKSNGRAVRARVAKRLWNQHFGETDQGGGSTVLIKCDASPIKMSGCIRSPTSIWGGRVGWSADPPGRGISRQAGILASRGARSTRDAVTLELPGECCRTDVELLRSTGSVPAVAIEHRQNVVLLDLV